MTYTQYSTINTADSPLLNPFTVFKEYLVGIYFITDPAKVLINYYKKNTDVHITEKGVMMIKIMSKGMVDNLSAIADVSDEGEISWTKIMDKNNPLYVGDDTIKGYYVNYEYITTSGEIYRWDFSVWSMFTDIYTNATSAGVSNSYRDYTFDGNAFSSTMYNIDKRHDGNSTAKDIYTKTEADTKFVRIDDPRIADWKVLRQFSTKLIDNSIDNSLTYTDAGSNLYYKASDNTPPPHSTNWNFYLTDGRPSDDMNKSYMPKPNTVMGDLNGYRNSFYFNRNENQLHNTGGRIHDLVYTLSHYESDSLGNSANDIYVGVKVHYPDVGVKVHYPERLTFNGTGGFDQTINGMVGMGDDHDQYSYEDIVGTETVIIHRPFSRNQTSRTIGLEQTTRLVTAQYCEHILERQRYMADLLIGHTVRNVRLSSTLAYSNTGNSWNAYHDRALVTGYAISARGPSGNPLIKGVYYADTTGAWVHSRVLQYYRNGTWRELGLT